MRFADGTAFAEGSRISDVDLRMPLERTHRNYHRVLAMLVILIATFIAQPLSVFANAILSLILQQPWIWVLAAFLVGIGVFDYSRDGRLTEHRAELGKANRALAIDYAVTRA